MSASLNAEQRRRDIAKLESSIWYSDRYAGTFIVGYADPLDFLWTAGRVRRQGERPAG